ncbi:MAG: hypothetical protein KAU28_10045 [Phycisphaerae bacterium]|nr:hypothetical protein [Phycisphaerae bacterium]
MVSNRDKTKLLGLGLDNKDGELRATHGKNFLLLGGSHETHQGMQEKCVKFNEKLDAKGKQLEQLEREEFLDIAAECKMNVAVPEPDKP